MSIDRTRHCTTTSHRRVGSKLAVRILLAVVSVALAIVVTSEVPIIGKDAQYYVQAGSLWADGKVSYAGSLIGMRIFPILYFYFFQFVFGASIDSVSISLGVLFLAFSATTVWFCYDNVRSEPLRASAFLIIVIVGFVWIDWRRPQTEPFMVILAIGGLTLAGKAIRSRALSVQAGVLGSIALLCGAGLGIRTECLILFLAVVLVWLTVGALRHEKTMALAVTGLMIVLFAIGSQAPKLAFKAFTGQDMPAQLTGYFVFFHPVEAFGNASYGPASTELEKLGKILLSQAPKTFDMEPIRLGLSGAYNLYGPKYASDLYMRAGFETVAAIPTQIAADIASSALTYLATKPFSYRMDWRRDDVAMIATGERLASIDKERLELSQWRLLGDFRWPTATIVDNRTSLSTVINAIDVPHVLWSLPAWVVAALTIAALFISARTGSGPWLVGIAALLYVGSCLAAAITQGFIDRYWLAASLPLMATIVVAFARLRDRQC